MLFQSLDRLKRSTLMTAIMLLFLGSSLLLIPEDYVDFMGNATAFVLAIVFVSGVLSFMTSKKALIHYIRLFFAMLSGMVSLILFLYPELLIYMLKVVVGILPILLGTLGNYQAFVFAQRAGRRGWWILVLLSSALIFFGAFSLFQPWVNSVSGISKVAGGAMMFSSIVFALELIWIWPLRMD